MKNMNGIIIALIVIAVVGVGYYFLSRGNASTALYPSTMGSQAQATTQTPSSSSAPVGADTVAISNFAFSPQTLTVKAGTTVTWVNQDTVAHQIKSNTFNSGLLNQGDMFKFTFSTPGTYNYSCGIHPNMTGTIVVK